MTWFSRCVERGERQEFALSPNGSRHIASDAGERLNGGWYEEVDRDAGAVLCIGERICAAVVDTKCAGANDARAERAVDARYGHGRLGPHAADDAAVARTLYGCQHDARRQAHEAAGATRHAACRAAFRPDRHAEGGL